MNQNHNLTDPALIQELSEIESYTGGRLAFAVRDLQSGIESLYNADMHCKTASIIKFPILIHIAMAVHEGTLGWNDSLILADAEKVGGSGVLTQLNAGLSLTLHDVCVLMTIVSDNTATNILIEHIGIDPVNQRMRELGLPLTTLYRKSYSPDTQESIKFGLGVTTPYEMLRLLTLIAENRIGSEDVCSDVIKIMSEQNYRDGIPRYFPSDWKYSGKTGSVDGVRNDIGIVTSPEGKRFTIAIFIQDFPDIMWTADNVGLTAIAKIARRLLIGN